MNQPPKTQFTPGPWKVSIGPDLSGRVAVQVHNGDNFVASCGTDKSTMTGGFERCEANARLIAAAPELFQIIVDAIAHGGEFQLGPKGRNANLENRLRENSRVKRMNIYQELKSAGVPLDNHASDLYALVTPESREIVARYQFRTNVGSFISRIDGKQWFDIPFAFEPFWEKKAKTGGKS